MAGKANFKRRRQRGGGVRGEEDSLTTRGRGRAYGILSLELKKKREKKYIYYRARRHPSTC